MTLSPRWRKLIGDFLAMRGRIILVVVALAIGLVGTITISKAYVILTREMQAAYLGTNPASGILDIGAVDAALVARVQAMDNIATAEPISIFPTRTRFPDGRTGRGLIFVTTAPLDQTISRVKLEQAADVGERPAALLERRSLAVAGQPLGGQIDIEIPGAGFVSLAIGGTVFDPALAPAEQEQVVYTYLDQATFVSLGGPAAFEMIKVRIADAPGNQARVDDTLTTIANALRADGVNVHLVQVPNADKHPHESPMRGVLSLFLVFGIIAFLLSTVLVWVTVEGLMVQQMRQIGIMKAIGGRARQIAALYLVGIGAIGLAALVIGWPIGQMSGIVLAEAVAGLLNFDIANPATPGSLMLAWAGAAMIVPLGMAAYPVRRATRLPVIATLSDQSLRRGDGAQGSIGRLLSMALAGRSEMIVALRGAFRKRSRTVMIVGLLALAGAVTMTARNVAVSFAASVDIAAAERNYDVDLRLTAPVPAGRLDRIASDLPNVTAVEPLLVVEAAQVRADGLVIVRTYPDGGHGSILLFAMQTGESLAHFTILDGAMPKSLGGGVIVNQSALGLLGNPKIGEQVRLSLHGKILDLPLLAVLRQYMTPASVFVSAADVAQQTGLSGANALRLSLSSVDPAPIVEMIEKSVEGAASSIAAVITENMMAKAVLGHVNMLIAILSALGVMMAGVGFIGLSAAQGISVAERRRDFGILRAIGARKRQIIENLLAEGAILWALALILGFLLSVPLSVALGGFVGRMTFAMPLPFTFDWSAIGLWSALSIAGTLIASLPSAFAAARLSVRETLAQQ